MTTNTKMMSIIEFTTTFIRENGSEKMIKQWESKATKAELKKLTFSDKKIKDPDAPKGALSAYMFFCKDQRSAVQNDIGDNAREITKELGSRWNTLKESHSNGKEKKLSNKKNFKFKNFKLFWNIHNKFRFSIVRIALQMDF